MLKPSTDTNIPDIKSFTSFVLHTKPTDKINKDYVTNNENFTGKRINRIR
jgi:hypothetical protein